METTESVFIRRNSEVTYFWCSDCGMSARMMDVEDAAAALGVSARSVYRWVEAGQIHFREEALGSLRVCLRSASLFAARLGSNQED